MTLGSLLADERALGYGAGISFVAPLGMFQALGRLTRDFGPLTLRMCLRIRVRELREPMGFCNAYFSVDDAFNDLSQAGDLVDFFDLAPLHVERVAVSVHAKEGIEQDVLVRARGPRRARQGSRIRVRVTLQRRHGERRRITVPVRVPPALAARRAHRLTLRGEGGSFSEEELLGELITLLEGEFIGGAGPSEPKTVRELAARIRALHRVPGIYAHFDRREPRLAIESDEVSFDGRARLRLRVMPRARR